MENEPINLHVIEVVGKVQGVFFRASIREVAEKLGISGTVRNLPNGSVLIHAEGSQSQLDQLEEWCRSGGPRHARVDRIEVVEETVREFEGFRIVR